MFLILTTIFWYNDILNRGEILSPQVPTIQARYININTSSAKYITKLVILITPCNYIWLATGGYQCKHIQCICMKIRQLKVHICTVPAIQLTILAFKERLVLKHIFFVLIYIIGYQNISC